MPMSKEIESVHNQLVEIAKETQRMSYRRHSCEDILKLQEKLSAVNASYYGNGIDSKYELEGQARVSDELDKVHQNIHHLLQRTE
ncbi:hypothetical protein BJ944DRAFT_180487 [Cunninghamella echinulata]|nr:hypothetical protein BJ944DRAFT_180487 [Cunninghamella echinulata]